MNTHHNPNTNPGLDTDPAHNDEHWWPRLADRINSWWIHREPTGPALREMLAIPPKPATAAILVTVASLATAAGLLIWWLVTTIVGIISGISSAIADTSRTATHHGAEHLTTWSITRTITDPVHAYLTHHATGLPITADLAWWTWLATTGGLFLLATLGSRGARIGWILAGATTVAMVYAATAPNGQMLAAGLAATVWAVGSIAAFNRLTTSWEPLYLTLPVPRRPLRSSDTTD